MTEPSWGPTLPFSQNLHATKYRQEGESFEDSVKRIASALSESQGHQNRLEDILLDMRFLPAGRIQAGAGAVKQVTLLNCFMSGIIEDNFTGADGIMQRCSEAAETMRMGGGVGFNFSRLRPRGELIKTLDSQSSGPVSFMGIYDAMCKTVSSSGHRRGAMMGLMDISHPDIEEFVKAKQNTNNLTGFNISVGITDEFMKAVINGNSYSLQWGGKKYKQIDAKRLWNEIMESTWDYSEPGVIFIDRIHEMNNLWYAEKCEGVNPCAEQPLPPFGNCLLGSFNLTKYIEKSEDGSLVFDYARFIEDIGVVVRAMDRVLDISIFPLEQQKQEAISKRRMGIGITGYANASEVLGWPYGSKKANLFLKRILEILQQACYTTSSLLAKEKGSFPLFDKEKFLQGKFVKTLSKLNKDLIDKFGLANSHLLSIAPTGTISAVADNISSGIEPVFAHEYSRIVQSFDGPKEEIISDWAFRVHGVRGKKAQELSADEHLNTVLIAQRYVDSAVSKTCNVNGKMSWEDFKEIYVKAWRGGAKGCTTYNIDGKRGAVLKEIKESEYCTVDKNGQKTCS